MHDGSGTGTPSRPASPPPPPKTPTARKFAKQRSQQMPSSHTMRLRDRRAKGSVGKQPTTQNIADNVLPQLASESVNGPHGKLLISPAPEANQLHIQASDICGVVPLSSVPEAEPGER